MKTSRKFAPSRLWRGALTALLVLIVPVAGFTQDTTSGIRGKVYDESGAPVVGASILVEDLRTGSRRSVTTNASGTFLASKLAVGGPYRVTVGGTKSIMVDSIDLGDTYNLTINMQEAAAVEEIVVIGQTAAIADVAAGPSAVFSAQDMAAAVAFNRDIKEVYSFDLLPEQGHQMPAFINLQQYYVEQYLVERCAEFSNQIDLRWKNRVTAARQLDDRVLVTVETPDGSYEAEADFVLACDGAGSSVRTMLGLDFEGGQAVLLRQGEPADLIVREADTVAPSGSSDHTRKKRSSAAVAILEPS